MTSTQLYFGYSHKSENLDSTVIQNVYYADVTREMYVEFQSKSSRLYSDVPAYVYHGLVESNSPGAYFNAYVKGLYTSREYTGFPTKTPSPTSEAAEPGFYSDLHVTLEPLENEYNIFFLVGDDVYEFHTKAESDNEALRTFEGHINAIGVPYTVQSLERVFL